MKDILINLIDKHCDVNQDRPVIKESWIIWFRGNQLEFGRDNKRVWSKEGYAKNALRGFIIDSFCYDLRDKHGLSRQASETIYNDIINDLIKSGDLEFIRIN